MSSLSLEYVSTASIFEWPGESLRRLISRIGGLIEDCGAQLDQAILRKLTTLPDFLRHEKEQTEYDPEGPGYAWYRESDVTYSCDSIRSAATAALDGSLRS